MGYRQTVLNDRPVIYWALGDPSSTVKSPDLITHIVPTHSNLVYGVPGPPHQGVALGFTSASSSCISATGTVDPGDTMSYEIWVRRTATGALAGIISSQGSGFYLRFNGDNTVHMLISGVVDALGSSVAITDTTKWYHIVCGNDAVLGRQIWINGVKVAEIAGASTGFSTGGNLFVNGENSGHANPGDHNLASLAIYKYRLSPAQILNHYMVGAGLIAS